MELKHWNSVGSIDLLHQTTSQPIDLVFEQKVDDNANHFFNHECGNRSPTID
jgi:hypothetical protein